MSTANFNRPDDEPEAANESGEIEAEIVDDPTGELAQAELAQARAEAAQFKDQLLRALAEAENTRRRSQREREESARYAAAPLGKDIVQVADNLQRALAAVPAEALANDEALRNLVEGIAAT